MNTSIMKSKDPIVWMTICFVCFLVILYIAVKYFFNYSLLIGGLTVLERIGCGKHWRNSSSLTTPLVEDPDSKDVDNNGTDALIQSLQINSDRVRGAVRSKLKKDHVDSQEQPLLIHVVFFMHGFCGNPKELQYLQRSLQRQFLQEQQKQQLSSSLSSSSNSKNNNSTVQEEDVLLLTHSITSNYGRTWDGVAAGGRRMALEIQTVLQLIQGEVQQILQQEAAQQEAQAKTVQPPVLQLSLSIIGHSLGGLYSRYALKDLYRKDILVSKNKTNTSDSENKNNNNSIRTVQAHPKLFLTTASPHLGLHHRTHFHQFVSSSSNSWAQRILRGLELTIGHVLQQTGRDLFRVHYNSFQQHQQEKEQQRRNDDDDDDDDDDNTDVIAAMATQPHFLVPLSLFDHRVAYANVYGTDFQVPTATAAFLSTMTTKTTQSTSPTPSSSSLSTTTATCECKEEENTQNLSSSTQPSIHYPMFIASEDVSCTTTSVSSPVSAVTYTSLLSSSTSSLFFSPTPRPVSSSVSSDTGSIDFIQKTSHDKNNNNKNDDTTCSNTNTSTTATATTTSNSNSDRRKNGYSMLVMTTPRIDSIWHSQQQQQPTILIDPDHLAGRLDALGWTKVFCDIRPYLFSIQLKLSTSAAVDPLPFSDLFVRNPKMIEGKQEQNGRTSSELHAALSWPQSSSSLSMPSSSFVRNSRSKDQNDDQKDDDETRQQEKHPPHYKYQQQERQEQPGQENTDGNDEAGDDENRSFETSASASTSSSSSSSSSSTSPRTTTTKNAIIIEPSSWYYNRQCWYFPFAHTILVANAKNPQFAQYSTAGKPIMDHLARSMVQQLKMHQDECD